MLELKLAELRTTSETPDVYYGVFFQFHFKLVPVSGNIFCPKGEYCHYALSVKAC